MTQGTFEEPEIIRTFDRSWKDKKERLQLERGEYNGRTTHTLRVTWQADDGTWRWSQARPSQSGKCWMSMSLKQKELRELGEALIAAAAEQGEPEQPRRVKDTPARVRAREKFDADSSSRRDFPSDDDQLPF